MHIIIIEYIEIVASISYETLFCYYEQGCFAAFQSCRANRIFEFPSCENRSNHVPTGKFPFAPLEKSRYFRRLNLHRWEKDGVGNGDIAW